jgi:hypothetical protein
MVIEDALGDPVLVDDRTYWARRCERLGNGTYRIEASDFRGGRSSWLIRGKGLYRDDALGRWRFMHYASVVRLTL